jgi:cyclophilin family peptidyl-prolyl cis-trans isomerase
MITSVLAAGILAIAGLQAGPRVQVTVENKGQMTVELYPSKAPKTVDHFLGLVRSRFYDGVLFHRVENDPRPFIIVTGDPLTKSLPLDDARIGSGGSGQKVPFEKNDMPFLNGTLGLSRDKKDENSGDSQFFICNGNQRFLEGTYVPFGRVIEGIELIAKIRKGDKISSIRELK